jgi:alpha-maltose-1-phosphate synthase
MKTQNKKVLLVNLWPGTPHLYAMATYTALRGYPCPDMEVHFLHNDAGMPMVQRFLDTAHPIRLAIPPKYTLVEYLKFPFQMPVAFLRLRNCIRKIAPDMVHILFSHPLLLLVLHTLPQVKVVTTSHDPIPHRGQPWIDRLWGIWEIRLARLIFVHCSYNRDSIKGIDTTRCVQVIGLGDTTTIPAASVKKNEAKNYVLFFGRITPYKGIEVLLSAMKNVWKQNDSIQLVIAGEGPIEKYSATILNDHRVRIVNRFIDTNTMIELFSGAQFLVLPYHEATQSAVISTAAKFHLPVIASAVGGIPEIVIHGTTGVLLPPGNPELLAEHILQLWSTPERSRAMGEAAFAFLQKNHSWERIAGQLYSGYRCVFGE